METFNLKIIPSLLATLISLTSCIENADNHVAATLPVKISTIIIPAQAELDQDIEIRLGAEGTNGCYRNFKISLTEIDSRHFLFTATAFFETYGACTDQMVGDDTTINFRSSVAGKYYFQTNKTPFTIVLDTLEIN